MIEALFRLTKGGSDKFFLKSGLGTRLILTIYSICLKNLQLACLTFLGVKRNRYNFRAGNCFMDQILNLSNVLKYYSILFSQRSTKLDEHFVPSLPHCHPFLSSSFPLSPDSCCVNMRESPALTTWHTSHSPYDLVTRKFNCFSWWTSNYRSADRQELSAWDSDAPLVSHS